MSKIYDLAKKGKTKELIKLLNDSVESQIAISSGKWGEFIDQKDRYRMTPLLYAAELGHDEIVFELIAKGANIEAKANHGMTPLLYASQNGYIKISTVLIAKGANVRAKNKYGLTALHYALQFNNAEFICTLIAKGSDINDKDKEGRTPLYIAAEYQQNLIIKYLLTLPHIQVNKIGPQSLLSFYPNDPEMTSLLRAKGVLEHRTANANGTINYNARGQSVHSFRTEETVKQTFDALMQAHNAESNPSVIDDVYLNFRNFLKSDNFSKLAKEISDDPNGFGSDRALHSAVKALDANKRYEVLMRDIAGNLNGIIQRVNHPANSQRVKDDFKKAISLVWLTLQQDEGWETLKGLIAEEEKAIERHGLMLTFIKGLFDIQHEYFNEGNSLSDAPHAACAPGTVNHTLAIFSQQHDKIFVTDEEPTPAYDPNGSIKDRLMADDYQRLIEILKTSFTEGFKDLEEALSGSSDTIPVLTKEMIDTFFRPNYTNRAIEGRLILIPEHTKLLESLLGKVKEQFYTQLDAFNVPNNPRMIIDAFIGLEDALDQMSVQRLAQTITPPAVASNSNPLIFSSIYNKLIPANIEQAYQSCQTTPEYINDMLERLTTNPESQRVNLFKEALKAYPEYSNESWFTSLPEKHKQTINQLIKNQIIFIKKTI